MPSPQFEAQIEAAFTEFEHFQPGIADLQSLEHPNASLEPSSHFSSSVTSPSPQLYTHFKSALH